VKSVRIGSLADNDLRFDQPMVSGHHAEIFKEGSGFFVVDLGSTNGTFVDGVRVTTARVSVGTRIGLGSFSFVLEAAHLTPLSSEDVDPKANEAGSVGLDLGATRVAATMRIEPSELGLPATGITLGGGSLDPALVVRLGSDSQNQVVVTGEDVASFHAEIHLASGEFRLIDLDSPHGVWFEGERIEGATLLVPGDAFCLGKQPLVLDAALLSHFSRRQAETMSLAAVSGERVVLRLGRASDNDIVVPAPQVSGHHAELVGHGGQWHLRDLGSLNGTYVNTRERRLSVGESVVVGSGDVLFLGSYRFPLSRIAAHDQGKTPEAHLVLPQDRSTVVIGRGADCDIVLDVPQVSRRHALLEQTEAGWELEDLGSANGTYIDGVRITRSLLRPGALVGFGTYWVRLDADAARFEAAYQGEIMLRAEGIGVEVREGVQRLPLLESIDFSAYPTELIGILGPSGAGKTTLLMALSGNLPPSQGRSLINNLDLYAHYDQFRGNLGYVPQEDIIHPELTVYESLYFAAKLRLPPDTSDVEISALIGRTLKDLGLEDVRDVLIGTPVKKGISGGQRKRVNLAQELLTQPSLLFLDEATSGLASSDARSVVQLLRRLADEGRTILLTIHQPSLEVYRELDNALYLARGRLVYYGRAYPDSLEHFCPQSAQSIGEVAAPALSVEAAMEVLAQDNGAADWPQRIAKRQQSYRSSRAYEDYVAGRREGQSQVQLVARERAVERRLFGWQQWWVLTRRLLRIRRSDRQHLAVLLLQAPLIGFLIGLVFRLGVISGEDPLAQFLGYQGDESIRAASLFMLVATAVWFGTSNAAREIVTEQAIYRRERMINLKIPSYVMSKVSVSALISLVQCVVLLGLSYPLLGLEGSFWGMLGFLYLGSGAGIGLGLLLSALVRSTEASVSLVPILLIPQLVLGGLVVPLSVQDGSSGALVHAASSATISRWVFEGLLALESAAQRDERIVRVSHEEEERAKAFELSPSQPSKGRRFGGMRFEDSERVAGLESLFRVRVARELSQVLQERTMVERYFGRRGVGPLAAAAVLVFFILFFILAVCVILRIKDRETA